MSEQQQSGNDLRDEFQSLGENLKQLFTSAWESEERKKLQQEIKDGMAELGRALDHFAEDMRTSEVSEKVRQEANEFGERVRSGEFESKAREGILNALQTMNAELQKAIDKLSGTEEESKGDTSEESSDQA